MKIIQQIHKHWITFWMVTAIMSFIAIGSFWGYSAYMGNSDMKRTISTKSISDIVFSSNIMKAPAQPKNLHESVSSDEYKYPVTVCNFEQMSPATHAKEKIYYDLTARLVKYDGNNYIPVTEKLYRQDDETLKIFQIQKTGDNNAAESGTIKNLNGGGLHENEFSAEFKNESLPEDGSYTDTFTLIFDREEMTKDQTDYYIEVTATPAANTVVSGTVREIKAWVSVSKGKDYGSKWEAVLIETDNRDYDAYNMQVTGQCH